jgi:predicted ATPase
MPLAIKLAANWLRVMSLGQIVAEVERSLDILTGQMRDIPDRQRSMNAVFESTWGMLSSEEQRAFASIAVFRGGFSAQAAQQVAEVSPYLLAGLVDHGLVRLGDEGRYEVHELTRQFAATKLRENEATNTFVPEKHSHYYLDFVIRECSNLYGQAPQASLAILKKDLANIRYAWDWAVEHWPLAELEPAVEPLAAFYEIAGFLVAGEQAFWMALEKHKRTSMDSVEQSTLFTLLMHYALFLILRAGGWKQSNTPKI